MSACAFRLCPLWFGIVVAGMSTTGCQTRTELDLVSVKGKVLVGNVPPAGALITFLPDISKGETTGAMAIGKIGADGGYELVTAGKPGAAVGRYRVTILATGSAETKMPSFHKKYSLFDKTDLIVEVVRDPDTKRYDLHLAQ